MNKLHDEDEESKEKKVDIQQNTAHSEDLNEYKTAKTTIPIAPRIILCFIVHSVENFTNRLSNHQPENPPIIMPQAV